MELKQKLIQLGACDQFVEWAAEKSLTEIWATCPYGDWMCWLLKNGNMCDLRTLTLIKARQASLVKHLMKDQRSLNALQAAFDFADGKISEAELGAYAAYAYAASDAAYAASDAAYAAAVAAYAASDAAYAAAVAAYAADAVAYAATATAAKSEILRQCADIVREIIPNPVFNN